MDDMKIGTYEWFENASLFGAQGIVDCTLQLLLQGEISRAKAREYIQDAVVVRLGLMTPFPDAPWDALNLCDEPRVQCQACKGTGLVTEGRDA